MWWECPGFLTFHRQSDKLLTAAESDFLPNSPSGRYWLDVGTIPGTRNIVSGRTRRFEFQKENAIHIIYISRNFKIWYFTVSAHISMSMTNGDKVFHLLFWSNVSLLSLIWFSICSFSSVKDKYYSKPTSRAGHRTQNLLHCGGEFHWLTWTTLDIH